MCVCLYAYIYTYIWSLYLISKFVYIYCKSWSDEYLQSTQSEDHRHHRKEKNKDAARKSRRKQTEKADILHEVSSKSRPLTLSLFLLWMGLFFSVTIYFTSSNPYICCACVFSFTLLTQIYLYLLSFIIVIVSYTACILILGIMK